MERCLQLTLICLLCAAISVSTAAVAADADNGRRLAEAQCATCHIVGLGQHRDVADAPPFRAIAQKFAISPELLAFSILEPHPRMNVTLTRREAQDIAAYINTLACVSLGVSAIASNKPGSAPADRG
jgi:mono/diheme cytochrome c family protein